MTNPSTIQAVADELKARNFNATNEYPGAIHIHTADGVYIAGTANETWGMDVHYLGDDLAEVVTSITLTNADGRAIPRTSADVNQIADAIMVAITKVIEGA